MQTQQYMSNGQLYTRVFARINPPAEGSVQIGRDGLSSQKERWPKWQKGEEKKKKKKERWPKWQEGEMA